MARPDPERHFVPLLALLALGLLALHLPAIDAGSIARAEIYFLDAARAMVERNDWVVPFYRGEPFFDKPAFTYWAIAAAFELFGVSLGAARTVPALAASATVLATAWLGAMLFGRRVALSGAAFLASTLGFLAFGRVAMSDMLLALWSTLAVALAVRATRAQGSWAASALGLALGLGFLTKGPIAIIIPAFGAMALLWRREGATRPRVLPMALGAALFALSGLGWFLVVYVRLGAWPLEYFFFRENLQRFAAATYDTGRPLWYYIPTYLAEGLPWSAFLPWAVVSAVRGDRQDGQGLSNARRLLAWTGLAVGLLSLSRGKLDYYLLPLYPAISLVIARSFFERPWSRARRAWTIGVLATLGIVVAAAALVTQRLHLAWLPGPLGRTLIVGAGLAMAGACLAVALRATPGRAAGALALVGCLSYFLAAAVVAPAFTEAQPNRAIAAHAARERLYRPDLRLLYCDDPTRTRREVLFFARVVDVEDCTLWRWASSDEPYLLLLAPGEAQSLARIPEYREVDRLRYLPATALMLRGLIEPEPLRDVVLGANFGTSDPEALRKWRRLRRHAIGRALETGDWEAAARQPAAASSKAP